MIGPGLGASFLSGQLALIQEIARNIGGDPLPPADATGTEEARESIAAPAPGEAVATPDDEALLSDRATGRPSASSAADLLAGLRAPAAALASPADYRQAMLQLVAGSAPGGASPPQNGGAPASDADQITAKKLPPEELPHEVLSPEISPTLNKATAKPATGSPPTRSDAAPARMREDEAMAAPANRAGPPRDGGSVRLAQEAPPPAATHRSAAADHSLPDQTIERARLALGLAGGAAGTSMGAEQGGILSSFILNAHFQPGWPPQRPIQDLDAKAFVQQLAGEAELGKDDIAMLMYLANFGLKKKQLSRLLKLVGAAGNRSKLLDALGSFFSSIGVALGALQEELELLAEEFEAARERRGKRERLDLR
jgi:hypothetical protein